MSPSVGFGAKPQSSLHREASLKRESGSEASPDSSNPSYYRREAEDGSLRDKSLSGAWGKAPIVTHCEASPKRESGSEAFPDSANPSYCRREAEDGSLRYKSLSGVWGKAPIVTPHPKKRSFGAECSAFCKRNGFHLKNQFSAAPL